MSDETSPLLNALNADSSTKSTANYASVDTVSVESESSSSTPPPEVDEVVLEPQTSTLALASVVTPMAIAIFLSAMDSTIVVSSYAAIGSDLNQLQNTSWIATGYLLTLTSFQPLYGKLSDIFGRKPCLLFALTIFGVGCWLCGLARNMTELIAARAFAGAGGGGINTVVSIIMSDIVPLRSRGTWQGIINIVFATGSAVGAPLGGFLADSIGWRWAFLVQVPVTVLAMASVSLALKLPKTSNADFVAKLKRVDFTGAIFLVLTVFSLLFGLDRGGNVSWTDRLTLASLVAFIVFFVIFATIEMELASEPFAPKRIICNSSLIASYLCNFFGVASALTMLFHLALYFQAVQGKTPSQAGLWLLPSIAAGVAGSLGGGLIMQATGKYYVLTAIAYFGLLVGAIIISLMTGVVVHSTIAIAIGLVTASLGNGTGITTSLIALIANAGPKDQAIATAVSYLFRSLGSVVGLSVGSTLVQDTLRSELRKKLVGEDVDEIVRRVRESLSYVETLDPYTRGIVRASYEQAVHVTLAFTVVMAACAAVSSLFIKEKALTR